MCFDVTVYELWCNLPCQIKCHECVASSGWRSTNEDAEHGEVPTHRYGHGTSYGEEEPEQLESPIPLVTMETALWDGP